MDPWFCTREALKAELDVPETAHANTQLDRKIAAATRSIMGRLVRQIAPLKSTRTKDWPAIGDRGPSWRIWLDSDELTAVDTLTSGGVTLTPDQYLLRPDNAPDLREPYTQIQVNLASTGTFTGGVTWQRDISITGTFGFTGYPSDWDPAGTITADTTSSGTFTVSDGSVVGVGSMIQVDTEWAIITGRRLTATADTLQSGLAANPSDQRIPVTSGATWAIGETVTVDAESMLIVDIAGNTLIVRRTWDGSTLAAHSVGAVLYTPRVLTAARGQQGTTAASHTSGAAVSVWHVPDLLSDLCVAQSSVGLIQGRAGYPQSTTNRAPIGPTSARPPSRPSDLTDLWDQAITAYGRRARIGAV